MYNGTIAIMLYQVAFLSGIAGSDLAETSARAAISALHKVHIEKSKFTNDIKVEGIVSNYASHICAVWMVVLTELFCSNLCCSKTSILPFFPISLAV